LGNVPSPSRTFSCCPVSSRGHVVRSRSFFQLPPVVPCISTNSSWPYADHAPKDPLILSWFFAHGDLPLVVNPLAVVSHDLSPPWRPPPIVPPFSVPAWHSWVSDVSSLGVFDLSWPACCLTAGCLETPRAPVRRSCLSFWALLSCSFCFFRDEQLSFSFPPPFPITVFLASF